MALVGVNTDTAPTATLYVTYVFLDTDGELPCLSAVVPSAVCFVFRRRC